MKYFSRLGFILLAMCLFQSHNAFAFNIQAVQDSSDLGFSLGNQKYYTETERSLWSQTFKHFETIVFEENIFDNGSHIVRISVPVIAPGGLGQIIAINKRISNPNNLDWDSILIEVSGVSGAIDGTPIPSADLADPTVGAGGGSAAALHLYGPVFNYVSQSSDNVILDSFNTIFYDNISSYAVDMDGFINLWFTLALPEGVTFYQFYITQTFIGSNYIGGGSGGPGSTVPEPGILLLVGLGFLARGLKERKN